ncbi:MAG: hypothetical protein AAF723_03675 [Pseudomonadota bacterium]
MALKNGSSIALLWSAFAFIASAFLARAFASEAEGALASPLHVEAPSTLPPWVKSQWEKDIPVFVTSYRTLFRTPLAQDISITTDYKPGGYADMSLAAFAWPSGISITLTGGGWQRKSQTGQGALEQNLAHELAHLWQLALYDDPTEPTWVHEGFAEALALTALAHSQIWGADEIKEWQRAAEKRCGKAMAQGRLSHIFQTQNDDAAYGCGFVLIDMMAKMSDQTPVELYKSYVEARRRHLSLEKIWEEILGPLHAGQIERFVSNDYSRARGEVIIRNLRAGRL